MTCTCGECGQGGELYLHSKCHTGEPTWTVLDTENKTLKVLCAVCDSVVVVIHAEKMQFAAPPKERGH